MLDIGDEMTNSTTDRRVGPHRIGRGDLPNPLAGGLASVARLSRRDLLRLAALAGGTLGAGGLLAACGGGGGGAGGAEQKASAGSLRALTANVPQLLILSAQTELPAGRGRFAFGLSAENNRLVEGVAPQVWLARDQTSKASGPFPARWLELTGYGKTKDRSPSSELTGFYLAEVEVLEPGTWLGVAMVDVASQRAAGQGSVQVKDDMCRRAL